MQIHPHSFTKSLYKVIHLETVSGFQEEKYKALYSFLTWDKAELRRLVEVRINKLIKRHYTKGDVSFIDVFPAHVDGGDTFDYMLERTFYRPRDIIMFVNDCLELCTGRPDISAAIIKEAECSYSLERLQSLANEWANILPDLIHTSRLFFGLKNHFEVSSITQEFLQAKFEEISIALNIDSQDQVTKYLYNLYTVGNANFDSIRNFILREFYAIGLIGIKTGPTDSISWTRLNNLLRLSAGQIRPSSIVFIHPMFYRALGIKL